MYRTFRASPHVTARRRGSKSAPHARVSENSISLTRPTLLQEFGDFRVLILNGDGEWCFAVVILLINVSSVFNEQLHEFEKAIAGRLVQGTGATFVARIDVRPVCQVKTRK